MSKASETVVFEYNADGLRVKKIATSTGTTHYTLHGKQITHLTNGQNTLHFFYDAAGKPAMVEWNNGAETQKFAYIHNLQGDIVGIIDSLGNEVVKYTYDAWGKPLSCTGTMAASLGKLNPFRYRGYVFDEETGLYYLKSRNYCPWLGRFINADNILGKRRILAHNIFTYCYNNPVVQSDSNGESAQVCVEPFDNGGTGAQIDITERLNQIMEEGYKEIEEYASKHSYFDTVMYFISNVQTNGKWDLKNRADWDLKLGITYVYNGIPLRWDEPGNICFGYIGSSIFGLGTLRMGAGAYQVYSGTSSLGYITSSFDDPLDSMCIEYGYYLKKKKRMIFIGSYETLEDVEEKFKEAHE